MKKPVAVFIGAVLATLMTITTTVLIPKRQVDKAGVEFIKKLEQYMPCPYHDDGGVWTVGYGTTEWEPGRPVRSDDECIDEQVATFYLKAYLAECERSVSRSVTSDINQNQFNALCSFSYNVGVKAFERSRLLRMVNHNPEDTALVAEFYRWVYVKKKVNRGLANRRRQELKLYFTIPIFWTDTMPLSSVRPDEVKAPS